MEFVPYEGQLLLLFKTIGMNEAEQGDIRGILKWFWAAGFNESLRGKPDHYVVRSVENWRGLIEGNIRGLEPRLKLSSLDLADRRLVSGGALSSTFVTMHAANNARSLQTGDFVDTSTYMKTSDFSRFAPVFSRGQLLESGYEGVVSSRLFGNVVLLDDQSIHLEGDNLKRSIISKALDGDWDTLRSQFMDEAAIRYLEQNRCRDFINHRVQLMFDKASELVDR